MAIHSTPVNQVTKQSFANADRTLANFSRIVDRAKHHGIRAVSLARRDYAGSTPFSEEELEQLRSPEKVAHLQFFRDRGHEIARFIAALADKHSLPPMSANGEGGICVLSWSLGVLTMNAFINFFPIYPSNLQACLRRYLKSLVAYGMHEFGATLI